MTSPDTTKAVLATTRPLILCTLRHYLPGYLSGGPVRSLGNLVDALGDTFNLHVVCINRDLGRDDPYPDIATGRWRTMGKARVMHLAPSDVSLRMWLKIWKDVRPNLLYPNSLFDPKFSILPAVVARARGTAVLLAPRGELSAGALRVKPTKKRVVLGVLRGSGLHARTVWHACSSSEAHDIRRYWGPAASIMVAPNIVGHSGALLAARPEKVPGQLRLLFLSRIAPKKNLLGAIRLAGKAGPGVRLDIWGPREDVEYADRCLTAARELASAVEVRWCGDARPEDVGQHMSGYDAFIFPTFGENFGHVIFEALSAGLPVVISDQTPWRGLKQQGVGRDLSLDDEDGFVREIRRLRDLGEKEFATIRDACRTFARNWALAHDGAAAHDAMFRRALGQSL